MAAAAEDCGPRKRWRDPAGVRLTRDGARENGESAGSYGWWAAIVGGWIVPGNVRNDD